MHPQALLNHKEHHFTKNNSSYKRD